MPAPIPVGEAASGESSPGQRPDGLLGEARFPCGVPQRENNLLRIPERSYPRYVGRRHCGREKYPRRQEPFPGADCAGGTVWLGVSPVYAGCQNQETDLPDP